MEEEKIHRITENVEYDLIDTKNKILLLSFDTQEGAEGFLINNPIYRIPQIKIVPTLTFRDTNSLNYLMTCLSTIYNTDKKNWFDNEVVNKFAQEFLERIDDIRSNETVEGYVS